MQKENSGRTERILSEIGRKIDEIIENTREGREGVKRELDIAIEELKKSKERLEKEFEEFTSNDDGKWTEVKSHLSRAVEEVKHALDSVFNRRKN